jgi:hypothetical protein
MITLDIHMSLYSTTPQAYVDKAKASVEAAAMQAGYPVEIHYVEGVPEHKGQARAAGYAQGSGAYKLAVDDDDYIEPTAFAEILPLLQQGVDAASAGEFWVVNDKVVSRQVGFRHKFAVYKAEIVNNAPLATFDYYPDQYLASTVSPTHINKALYYYRIWRNAASRKWRLEHCADAKAERERVGGMKTFQEQAHIYGRIRQIARDVK